MQYIPARPFCNNVRQLFVLRREVSYFEDLMPILITAFRRSILYEYRRDL